MLFRWSVQAVSHVCELVTESVNCLVCKTSWHFLDPRSFSTVLQINYE
jgi:hypothetical protein